MVRFVPSLRSLGLSILLMAFITGCGGSSGDGFKGARGQVTGTLKYQDKPVPVGSAVLFQAKDSAGYIATGAVAADGKFEMTYKGSKDLPAVEYMVIVTPPAVSGPAASTDPAAVVDGEKLAAAVTAASAVIPSKYNSAVTTDLVFPVKAGANTANLVLKD